MQAAGYVANGTLCFGRSSADPKDLPCRYGLPSIHRSDSAFWDQIYAEYQRSKKYLLKLTGQSELMENEPAGKASILVREKIVLPLLTIQQYALGKLHQKGSNEILEKMVTRSLF